MQSLKNRRWMTLAILVAALAAAGAVSRAADGPKPLPKPTSAQMDESIKEVKLAFDQITLIEHLTVAGQNYSATGIAAVMAVKDVVKDPLVAIEFLERMIQRSDDEAVRRVARMQLVELYKQSDQPDKALEQLQRIIMAPRPIGQ